MTPEQLAGLGALFSGLGSIIGAILSVRFFRRREQDECDKRIAEIRKAFREGMRMRRQLHREDEEDRWSHLP